MNCGEGGRAREREREMMKRCVNIAFSTGIYIHKSKRKKWMENLDAANILYGCEPSPRTSHLLLQPARTCSTCWRHFVWVVTVFSILVSLYRCSTDSPTRPPANGHRTVPTFATDCSSAWRVGGGGLFLTPSSPSDVRGARDNADTRSHLSAVYTFGLDL